MLKFLGEIGAHYDTPKPYFCFPLTVTASENILFHLCHFFLNENVICESYGRCFRLRRFCQSHMALGHLCQYTRVIDWEILLTDSIDYSYRSAQTSL